MVVISFPSRLLSGVMQERTAAQARAAAELRARHAQLVPQVPEQRHFRIAVELAVNSVDLQIDHDLSSVVVFRRAARTVPRPAAASDSQILGPSGF